MELFVSKAYRLCTRDADSCSTRSIMAYRLLPEMQIEITVAIANYCIKAPSVTTPLWTKFVGSRGFAWLNVLYGLYRLCTRM